jgi:hypothetical protein
MNCFSFFWDRKDKTDVGDRSDRKAKDRESFDSREILEVYGKYRYLHAHFAGFFFVVETHGHRTKISHEDYAFGCLVGLD